MNRDQKAAVVDELAEEIRAAEAIFAVDYRGITVSQAADLRTRLREADTRFRVVKNSLTERASDKAGAESLKELLEGPTALAFVVGDAALAAKALNDQARALGTLEFKGGLMDGAPLTADEIKTIARLPARDVLHGQLVGVIASPLSGLVRTLNALVGGLALQLGQIAEQGLVSGESSSAPEVEVPQGESEAGDETARSTSGADDASPEPEAEAPAEAEAEAEAPAEPEAEAPAEPEAEAPAEPEAEPQAEAEAEAPAEPAGEATEGTETEASEGEADEPKEEA